MMVVCGYMLLFIVDYGFLGTLMVVHGFLWPLMNARSLVIIP